MSVEQEQPQAAWYVDPSTPGQIRYWDGTAWTEHVAPLETVADLHTGHFEAIRTEAKRSLGLADGPARIARQRAAQDKTNVGAHFEIEPPELGGGWFVAEKLELEPDGITTEHVVVGTAGVFALMSRDHSGSEVWVADRSFLVDDHSTDYLREAKLTSQALTQMLRERCGFKVAVEPVIIVKAKKLTIKSQPHEAHVVAADLLGSWLMRLEPVLLPSAVQQISAAVGGLTTVPEASGYPDISQGDDEVLDLTEGHETEARSFSPTSDEPVSASRRSLFN